MNKLYRCLLVEDDEDDQELFQIALDHLQLQIQYKIASDPETALTILKSYKWVPDIIITDWNMPKMNGGEFVRKLQSVPFLTSIPIVILSTSTTAFEQTEGLHVQGCFTKPVKFDEYVDLLLRFFR